MRLVITADGSLVNCKIADVRVAFVCGIDRWFLLGFVDFIFHFQNTKCNIVKLNVSITKLNFGAWFPGNVCIWREMLHINIKKYIRNYGKYFKIGGKLLNCVGKS